MDKFKKILIADDHALILQGLRQVLEQEASFKITEANDGDEVLNLFSTVKPDVLILDIEMPKISGYDVAKKLLDKTPKPNIIFLTMYKQESMFNKAMDIGVKGYVLKENTVGEITDCVKAVLNGEYYISPAISSLLIRRNKNSTYGRGRPGIQQLTQSEKTILNFISKMKTNPEIAKELGISVKTVQNHRNNICNKLELKGAHALLKYAIENRAQF